MKVEVNPSEQQLYEGVGIAYDMSTYVRFDKYGLYGIKNNANFIANSPEDIENNASFGVTWKGFFIKNSYTNGYISISEDDDIKVVKITNGNEIKKIKIGALEFNANNEPTRYGISIRNDADLEVFKTDDNGDIIANNITIKGAIKASVFEYEEVQAVGGILVVRPSSTIKSIVGPYYENDSFIGTEITLENPDLFKDKDRCKLGYNGGYYTLLKKIIDEQTHLILKGFNEEDSENYITYQELIGSALIMMIRPKIENNNTIATDNYGIAINSSDSNVQVPQKAITLFETQANSEILGEFTGGEAFSYRGILGTLPNLGNNYMSPAINHFMAGTQGIYTNNMYIGDKNQYLAFYRDGNGDAQLRLVAKSFEILPDDSDLPIDLGDSIVEEKIQYNLSTSTTENTEEEEWSDTPYEESSGYYLWQRTYVKYAKGTIDYLPTEEGYYMAAGQPGPAGPPGEDAAVLVIDSSEGTVFRDNTGTTDLTVTIFYGSQVITNSTQLHEVFGIASYLEWEYKDNTDNWIVLLISDPRISDDGFTLSVDAEDVYNKANFRCKLVI